MFEDNMHNKNMNMLFSSYSSLQHFHPHISCSNFFKGEVFLALVLTVEYFIVFLISYCRVFHKE